MKWRRRARECAVQFLYALEYPHDDPTVALRDFWEMQDEPVPPKMREMAEGLIWGVLERQDRLDLAIRSAAENWDLRRMSRVDRNILRLAAYEMFYREDIPPVVSIDEAVDMARDFSGEISAKFVNGVLDRIGKTLMRPLRTALEPDMTPRLPESPHEKGASIS